MSSGKWMNAVCIAAIVLSLIGSVCTLLPAAKSEQGMTMGYESRLFDPSRVHTIDIRMDAWDEFIQTCENEEYAQCRVTIDGENYPNAAIRAKGNTSLSSVSKMDSDRYSFKIEFDHFDSAFSYHGLDKLSLNNLIQDNTFMKDYLTLRMMNAFGVKAPLTSFAFITVNGEDWGLYLAVEGVEDAFLKRNYGNGHGELYKPDSMSFGGGRGNGRDFDLSDVNDGFSGVFGGENSFDPSAMSDMLKMRGGGRSGMGSSDVKLQYTDDSFESYSNIFDNAKTDVTDQDKRRLIEALKKLSEGDTQSVDIENVLRYFVVHNYTVNDDSYTGTMIHNYYLYEKDGALSMIPWDYNLAYGTFQGGNASVSVNKDIDNPVSGGTSDRPMIDWIFKNEEYTMRYHELFSEFLNTVHPVSIIEEAEALIAPYIEKDPTKFCTLEEFQKGVEALKTFVTLRSESVLNQLSGINRDVNTQGLNTADMGTMSNGMGDRNGMQMPEIPQGGMQLPGMPTEDDQMPEMSQGGMQLPGMPTEDGQMPEMPQGGMQLPGMPTEDGQMPEMPQGGMQFPGMPAGDGQIPEMPQGGMQFPGMPAGDGQIPEMPQGGMQFPGMPTEDGQIPEMSQGGMQLPGMPAGDGQIPEIPQSGMQAPGAASEEVKAAEEVQPEKTVEPTAAPNPQTANDAIVPAATLEPSQNTSESADAKSNRQTRFSGRNAGEPPSIGFPSSSASLETGPAGPSGGTLLLVSICVLLISIAFALFIRH